MTLKKSSAKQNKRNETIELAMETFSSGAKLSQAATLSGGEVNTCFVMDSSSSAGEERIVSGGRHVFSSSSSSAAEKSTSSLIQSSGGGGSGSGGVSSAGAANTVLSMHQHHLLLSSPSSTSSTSLIKSEFINNLNGAASAAAAMATGLSSTVAVAETPSLTSGGVEFSQNNIIIKSVDINGVITSTPGASIGLASPPQSPTQTTVTVTATAPKISDLDLESMLNASSEHHSAGLHERIVMSKKMIVEKGFKANLDVRIRIYILRAL